MKGRLIYQFISKKEKNYLVFVKMFGLKKEMKKEKKKIVEGIVEIIEKREKGKRKGSEKNEWVIISGLKDDVVYVKGLMKERILEKVEFEGILGKGIINYLDKKKKTGSITVLGSAKEKKVRSIVKNLNKKLKISTEYWREELIEGLVEVKDVKEVLIKKVALKVICSLIEKIKEDSKKRLKIINKRIKITYMLFIIIKISLFVKDLVIFHKTNMNNYPTPTLLRAFTIAQKYTRKFYKKYHSTNKAGKLKDFKKIEGTESRLDLNTIGNVVGIKLKVSFIAMVHELKINQKLQKNKSTYIEDEELD